MSRHRDIRNLNYEEEYDEAHDDTVYGRSVDECDYGVSPSSEQYLYSHAHSNFSNYLPTGEGITEEDGYDEYYQDQGPYKKPELSDEDEARLQSILDQLRGILGDSAGESEMTAAVIDNKFDMERSLDILLNKTPQATADEEAQGGSSKPVTVQTTTSKKKNNNAASNSKQQKNTGNNKSSKSVAKVSTPSVKVVRGFDVPQPLASSKNNSSLGDDSNKSAAAAGAAASCAAVPKPIKLPTRQRDGNVDVSSLWAAACADGGKELINLVVVGHVDAGKSTLTGHLLYEQGNVSKRVMHKYEQESKKSGKQSMFAWVMDDTEEERSRGVTVDVAERSFETGNRVVNILDAPGHRDFIPNMISGAARADVALLVVDASTGEFEAGFESNGQTREHAMLIKSLGVSQIAVTINKLDTVKWSETRYKEIKSSLTAFLKTVGYKSSDVAYIPCSGLTGENLVKPPTEAKLISWYKGPTVLQAIDGMKSPEREVLRPTRFSISDVFKGSSSNMCVSGKLHTGYIQPADKLLLLPHTVPLTVKDVVSSSGTAGRLFAGDSGVLTVSGADPDVLHVGDFLCDPASPMKPVTRLQARIVVFNVLIPLIRGTQVEFHHQSLCEPATVTRLWSQINKSTGEVMKKNPRVLAKQSAGVVDVELKRPICLETYKDNKDLGRFMLRQQGVTVAAGLVTQILDSKPAEASGGSF